MTRQTPSTSERLEPDRQRARPLRVLVVDQEPGVCQLLQRVISPDRVQLGQVGTLAEARLRLKTEPVDLALIEWDLPDGSGIALTGELRQCRSMTQTIVISSVASHRRTIEAIRAGATDFIAKPLSPAELNERVREAMRRLALDRDKRRRVRRLKRTCRKLNSLRSEVAQQVDILCNDLVTAYQELAQQMQQAMHATEFAALLRHEIDLEQLLRKTLEFLLSKVGPTNAAIFLPASTDQFTLGGYINYDCASDSADILLDHLADVLAQKVAEREEPVHITDNDDLATWMGDDSTYFLDSHVLAFSCRHDSETLAVAVLFRDMSQPFDPALCDVMQAIAPLLGDCLAKVTRIHHRNLDGINEDHGDVAV